MNILVSSESLKLGLLQMKLADQRVGDSLNFKTEMVLKTPYCVMVLTSFLWKDLFKSQSLVKDETLLVMDLDQALVNNQLALVDHLVHRLNNPSLLVHPVWD